MNNLLDAYIRRSLKNWADRHDPPANGRARLLLLAATSVPKVAHIPSFRKLDRRPFTRTTTSLASSLAAEKFHNNWLWMFQVA